MFCIGFSLILFSRSNIFITVVGEIEVINTDSLFSYRFLNKCFKLQAPVSPRFKARFSLVFSVLLSQGTRYCEISHFVYLSHCTFALFTCFFLKLFADLFFSVWRNNVNHRLLFSPRLWPSLFSHPPTLSFSL